MTKRNVLLVDDDTNLLAAVRRTFRDQPFRLVEAQGPAQAFERLAMMEVDVVISDERMPGMSGTQFLARVRQQYPRVISIMLTGHADLGVAMEAINRGEVHRFLVKPCDPVVLAHAIKSALQHHELVRGVRGLLSTVRRQAAVIEGLDRPSGAAEVLELTDAPVDLDLLLEEVMLELDIA